MSEHHSGDTVQTIDGREALAVGSRFRVGGGDESSETKIRHQDGSTEYVPSSSLALVRHGVHEYRTGEQRGRCGRCGVQKRLHGTTSSTRGMKGEWATPHGEAIS